MAVAQAVGAIIAVFVGFGWGIVGPAQVAGMATELRGQYLRDSVVSRGLLFACSIPVYIVLVVIIVGVQDDFFAYAVAGFSTLAMALGSGWFFIGEASPARLLFWESIPRAAGLAIAVVALVLTRSLLVYTIIQLVFIAISIVLTTRDIERRYLDSAYNRSVRDGFRRLSGSYAALVTAGTSTFYVNAPLLVISLILPGVTPVYAAAEKIQRFALNGMAPITQVVQGYIPSATSHEHMVARIKRSLTLTTVVAVVLGALIAALLPLVAFVITTGKISVPFSLSIPMGFTSMMIGISSVTGLAALVSLGKARTVAMSTVIGAVIGLPLTILMAFVAGMVGAAWAVTASELLVLVYQLIVLSAAIRQRSHDGANQS
jgi:O-antigen/teichoic acid export membrane protein